MEDVGSTCTFACGVGPQAVFNGMVSVRRAGFNTVKGVKAEAGHVCNSKTKLEKFSCEM